MEVIRIFPIFLDTLGHNNRLDTFNNFQTVLNISMYALVLTMDHLIILITETKEA